MLFYKVTATIDEGKKKSEGGNNSLCREGLTEQISETAEEFNRSNGSGLYCFVSRIHRNTITGGIISEDPVDADRVSGKLFTAAKIKVRNKKCSETVLHNILEQLSSADGNG
ncbi:MAG: hypothetical protein IKI91_04115, partial [Clostridia bacterium]|nr:hypothetical protein [Clostridia bacterium]